MLAILTHYALGLGAVTLCVLLFVFATALAAEAATVPLIGPWLGRNIQHIRDWALVAAVIIGGATVTYGIGVHDGKVSVQAKWDKAEQAAVKRGADARTGAERSVGKSPATPGLRDQFNRDN